MAGLGSRFSSAGYSKPKPFIDVNGKPMIIRVLENLKHKNANFLLIAQEKHIHQEIKIVRYIEKKFKAKFISIDGLTEGTACTLLFARNFINNDNPLVIANSDQLVDFSIQDFLKDSKKRNLDGSILTFIDELKDPKWSFAKLDNNGFVKEVKEKEPISNIATVGIYLFTKGCDFVDYCIEMIIKNERVNNEFYTCPVYNLAINNNKKIGVFKIKKEQMHGLGTPDDLAEYLSIIESYKTPLDEQL